MFGHICRIRPFILPGVESIQGHPQRQDHQRALLSTTAAAVISACFTPNVPAASTRNCRRLWTKYRPVPGSFWPRWRGCKGLCPAPQGAKKHPQQAFQRFLTSGSKLLRVLYYFILLAGVRVTKFCAAPAQGRRSRWAWTKSRSCRFPRRCGGPRQRRWRSWQGSAALPAQGRPVREFSGWRYSHP